MVTSLARVRSGKYFATVSSSDNLPSCCSRRRAATTNCFEIEPIS